MSSTQSETHELALRTIRLGWWLLLLYLSLGIVLEVFHGLKIGWYLDVSNHTRRLMFTLAHTHGTLLALVHIAFGVSVITVKPSNTTRLTLAARCLNAAGFILPAGFFLGGLYILDGDPGLGILLVPVGALFLFISVLLTAQSMAKRQTQKEEDVVKEKKDSAKPKRNKK